MNTAAAVSIPSHSSQSPPLHACIQGEGETVVCLHSSTGSHAQWSRLAGQLSVQFRPMSIDLHGHGRSPAWPAALPSTLDVDGCGVTALLRCADGGLLPQGVHLVGHSYGGAVALQIALRHPRWVRSLTLYEPVAFGVIEALAPQDAALGEIDEIARSVAALVRGGDLVGASRVFCSYWGGAEAWAALGAQRQAGVCERIATVPRHFEALAQARWGAAQLAKLTMPVLLMHGSRTREPARRVAELLAAALPQAQRVEIVSAGHLGPITHEPMVSEEIVAQLQQLACTVS